MLQLPRSFYSCTNEEKCILRNAGQTRSDGLSFRIENLLSDMRKNANKKSLTNCDKNKKLVPVFWVLRSLVQILCRLSDILCNHAITWLHFFLETLHCPNTQPLYICISVSLCCRHWVTQYVTYVYIQLLSAGWWDISSQLHSYSPVKLPNKKAGQANTTAINKSSGQIAV